MIPILFENNVESFTDAPYICRLVDCLSCFPTEGTDGLFECQFTYPTTGRFYNEIRIGRTIYAEYDAAHRKTAFDIYAYDISANGIATFYTRHISYRLSNLIVSRASGDGASSLTHLKAILEDCVEYDAGSTRKVYNVLPIDKFRIDYIYPIENFVPYTEFFAAADTMSARDVLLSVPQIVFNVAMENIAIEYLWDDFSITGYVSREGSNDKRSRGSAKPVVIRYMHNLMDYRYEYIKDDAVQGIIPIWIDSDTHKAHVICDLPDDEDMEDLTDVVGVALTRDEQGNESFIHFQKGDAVKARGVDFSNEFDAKPTDYQLMTAAEIYFKANQLHRGRENLTITYKPTQEYAKYYDTKDVLCLCDICTVIIPEIGISRAMKVVKTTYDTLNERYEQLEFGSAQRTLFTADTVGGTPPESNDEFIYTDDTQYIDPEDIIDVVPDD